MEADANLPEQAGAAVAVAAEAASSSPDADGAGGWSALADATMVDDVAAAGGAALPAAAAAGPVQDVRQLALRRMAARFLAGHVTRKVIKQTVMTSVCESPESRPCRSDHPPHSAPPRGPLQTASRSSAHATRSSRASRSASTTASRASASRSSTTSSARALRTSRARRSTASATSSRAPTRSSGGSPRLRASSRSLSSPSRGSRPSGYPSCRCAREVAGLDAPSPVSTPPSSPRRLQPYRREHAMMVRTVLQDVVIMDSSEQLPVSTNRQRSAFPPK